LVHTVNRIRKEGCLEFIPRDSTITILIDDIVEIAVDLIHADDSDIEGAVAELLVRDIAITVSVISRGISVAEEGINLVDAHKCASGLVEEVGGVGGGANSCAHKCVPVSIGGVEKSLSSLNVRP